MEIIEKLKKKFKMLRYLQTRSHRRSKYSSTYLKSLNKYKYKTNDIVFVPDIHFIDSLKIPRIYKYKIEDIIRDEITVNTLLTLGPVYRIKHLNRKLTDGYCFLAYENEMFSSYSEAYERLKKLAKTYDLKLNQDNWIDFPY